MNRGNYFFDMDGQPIGPDEWEAIFYSRERLLAQEDVGPYYISTVWLGIDHGTGEASVPVIFETMIFGDDELPLSDQIVRYTTREEALKGHQLMVTLALAEIDLETPNPPEAADGARERGLERPGTPDG